MAARKVPGRNRDPPEDGPGHAIQPVRPSLWSLCDLSEDNLHYCRASFSGGVRSCIGCVPSLMFLMPRGNKASWLSRWRFAYISFPIPSILSLADNLARLLEMQAILMALIEHFEFSPAPGNPEIIRSATSIMSPMYGLPQIPIFVTSYSRLI